MTSHQARRIHPGGALVARAPRVTPGRKKKWKWEKERKEEEDKKGENKKRKKKKEGKRKTWKGWGEEKGGKGEKETIYAPPRGRGEMAKLDVVAPKTQMAPLPRRVVKNTCDKICCFE